MFKKIFNKVYSPKNQDDISIKKTKYNILIFFILFITFHAIVAIVIIKDSKNRLTFVESKIENDLQIPSFFLSSNISSFSYNVLNISDDPNEINYKTGCEFDFLNGQSSCGVSPYFNYTEEKNLHYPYYKPSNITFQKTYIRIISNIIKIENATHDGFKRQKISAVVFKDDSSLYVSPPARVEYLFKKEVYIDRYGKEKVHLIPVLITSPLFLDICNNLTREELIMDCYTVDISILYQTNVVLYYSEETDRQFITRILADISSISRLVLYLVFVALSFMITRFLFDQKTAWFPNYIRDGILYHYKYYRVQLNLKTVYQKESPSLFSRITSKFKKGKQESEFQLYEERNQYLKVKDESYKIKKATEGSKIKLKRIFQSIKPQDEDSDNLSKVSNVNTSIFVSIMIIISSIILFKNMSYRIATTQFETQLSLELPKLNFTFIGDHVYWDKTYETLPNGQTKDCKYLYVGLTLDSIDCESSSNFSNSGGSSIVNGHSVIVDSGTIFMDENEIYQYNIDFKIFLYGLQIYEMNNLYLKLTINEIDHFVTPFSNITMILEKTVFHNFDGTNITMYDTNLIVSEIESLYYEKDSWFTIFGRSLLNIQYQDHQIRHIYEETDLRFGFRILQYIMAFSSPLSIIIGFIFTYFIIKFWFKTPSAHCEPKVRESIIYFLNYNKRYPEIFN